MAIIKNPVVIVRTQEGGYDVQQVLLPDNTCRLEITEVGTTRDTISITNIEIYKAQDRARIIREGGELATDEEYSEAEEQLQQIYAKIMGVEL